MVIAAKPIGLYARMNGDFQYFLENGTYMRTMVRRFGETETINIPIRLNPALDVVMNL